MRPKQNRWWWWIALDLLLAAGLLVAGWEYRARLIDLNHQQRQLAEWQTARLTLAERQAALTATAVERAKLDAYFINPDQLAVFIEELEKLATVAKVDFNLTSAQIDNKNQLVAHFNLEVGGSFQEVFQFLGLVENMPFGLSLRQVQLGANFAAGKQSLWQGGLSIQLNSLLENKLEITNEKNT